MDTTEIVTALREPFPQTDIKKRPGGGYEYIDQENIMSRLLDATGGVFDITINEGPKLVTYPKPSTGETLVCWLATVTLTIPGLGSRTNVGTSQALNEDAPKSAVTDAIKKAATLFGVALQLYEKDAPTPAQSRTQPNAQGTGKTTTSHATGHTVNSSGSQCTYCRAPDGKAHLKTCPTLQEQAA